jgi:hypothetical protein
VIIVNGSDFFVRCSDFKRLLAEGKEGERSGVLAVAEERSERSVANGVERTK